MSQSSYLSYLPPVLWSHESDSEQLLGRLLRVFEKLLTGIADGVAIEHGDHTHRPLEETIDRLPDLFDPWRAPPNALPWLASWLALSLHEDWSDYQRRKLIAEMVGIYQQRGLKQGMYAYLDMYSVTQTRPRIAIDEGEALFGGALTGDSLPLRAIAHGSAAEHEDEAIAVLLHPSAVAVDSENRLLVTELGTRDAVRRPPALWQLSSTGELSYAATPPLPTPRPLHAGAPFHEPVAVVVDDQDRYSLLDIGRFTAPGDKAAGIYRFAPPELALTTVVEGESFGAVHPVAMALDTDGRFVVLDRGGHLFGFPGQGQAAPRIVVVSEEPLEVAAHELDGVAEPTALALDRDGTLIIADAQEQDSTTPANLLRVDPRDNWATSPLLSDDPAANPLIYPTGIAFEREGSLLVCDAGLRRGFVGDQSNRAMAEPAALYRVELARDPPVITPLGHERQLVYPTGIAIDRTGRPIIADRGGALRLGDEVRREWRAQPYEFGVVVHFSAQRPTNAEERNRIRRGIEEVVAIQKPAHTFWWLEF